MFKKVVFALALVFGVSLAAQAADLKVGVVNMQQLMAESPQGKKVMAEMKKEFGPRQQKLEAKQKQGQELQKKLQRNSSVMSKSERDETQKQLRDLQRELQVEGQSFQEDVQSERQEKLGGLQKVIMQAVQGYASENNYDLVLPSNASVYAGSSVDITDAVMKKMEAAAK